MMRAAITALALCLLLASCAAQPSSPSTSAVPPGTSASSSTALQEAGRSAGVQALIDAARAEGQLTLVWSESVFGGSEGVRQLADRFNRQYGLQLTINFTPGPSMAEGAVKLIQESQADRPAFTDVIAASSNQVATMMRAGVLEPVDWASWAPNVRDPRAVAPNGVAVPVQSILPGITYNSSRVAPTEVPRSLNDLLQPQYRGRIASTPYAAYFGHLAAPDLWGGTRAIDYVRALADQVAGLIRCNETQRIISGEFDILAIDCAQNLTLRAKAQGAPVDFVIPTDAPLVAHYYAAVPKKAPHPNAAKLWLDFLLSRETQDFLYDTDDLDLHYLPGSKTAKLVEQLEAGGTKFVLVDVDFYQRNDEQELDRILAEQQRLLLKR